jgi:hypothetical protein
MVGGITFYGAILVNFFQQFFTLDASLPKPQKIKRNLGL